MLAGIAIWLINYCGHTRDVTGQMKATSPECKLLLRLGSVLGQLEGHTGGNSLVVSECLGSGRMQSQAERIDSADERTVRPVRDQIDTLNNCSRCRECANMQTKHFIIAVKGPSLFHCSSGGFFGKRK